MLLTVLFILDNGKPVYLVREEVPKKKFHVLREVSENKNQLDNDLSNLIHCWSMGERGWPSEVGPTPIILCF